MKCESCGEDITGYGKRFCSLSCSNKKRPDKPTNRNRIIKSCFRDECDIKFETTPKNKKKYCSRSCSAIVNNTGVSRHNEKVTLCLECNKSTQNSNRGFCSIECRNKSRLQSWLDGKIDGGGKYTLKSWARSYILDRAKWQCEGVGLDGLRCKENRLKPGGTTVLTIDHIDGNWKNNQPYNLRALCPTCHALTENYGAANMGSGRTWKKNYSQFERKVS